MNLWLPEQLRGDPNHPTQIKYTSSYSLHRVTGVRSSVADVVAELCPIKRDDAIRWYCAVSNFMVTDHAPKPREQLGFASSLFPPLWTNKIRSMMEEHPEESLEIFHCRAMWLTLQLIFIACKPDGVKLQGNEVAERVARACFLANDVVESIDRESTHEIPDVMSAEDFVASVVPVFRSGHTKLTGLPIGRSLTLWDHVANDAKVLRCLKKCNAPTFELAFLKKYGVSLKEFLRFMVMLVIRLQSKVIQ